MITITDAIRAIDIELLKFIGQIIHNEVIFGFLILVLIFLSEKRKKLIVSIIIALLAGIALKQLVAIDRPCVGDINCPKDFSFPSNHAIAVFTVAISNIKKREFSYYLLFALFVSFTRINIGVHTLFDIEGSLVISFLSYYVVRSWKAKDN